MSWDKIKGNQEAKDFLKNVLLNQRVAHAYLFCGPAGVGKSIFAREFAKALLESDKQDHPDLMVVAPQSKGGQIKIADIRQLQSKIYLKPYEAKYRVCIIDEAEDLNEESSNALLKVLEEPPDFSVLMLIATSAQRLLPTIVSRCQLVRFNCLGIRQVQEILELEHGLGRDKAHYLASMSQGRLGAAVAMKDSEILQYRDSVLGWFLKKTKDADLELENASRQEQKDALEIICSWYRDVLFYKVDEETQALMNIDKKEELAKWARAFSFPEIEGSIEAIFRGHEALKANANPKVAMPVVMGRLARI